jgi:hypothetical protein
MLTQVLNLVGQYFPGCHFCCFKRIHFNSGFRITAIVKYNKVKGLDKKKQPYPQGRRYVIAPAKSSPVARTKPISAPNRFKKGFSLKQIPLRIQLSITNDVNKKALVDVIKKAPKSSSSRGRLIDLRDLGAQRDSKTPYPASNTQSDT